VQHESCRYLRTRGDQRRKAECLTAAIAICREIGDRDGTAFCDTALGDCFIAMDDYPTAMAHGRAALATAAELGMKASEADARRTLGVAYLLQGDTETAGEYRYSALALHDELGPRCRS